MKEFRLERWLNNPDRRDEIELNERNDDVVVK